MVVRKAFNELIILVTTQEEFNNQNPLIKQEAKSKHASMAFLAIVSLDNFISPDAAFSKIVRIH